LSARSFSVAYSRTCSGGMSLKNAANFCCPIACSMYSMTCSNDEDDETFKTLPWTRQTYTKRSVHHVVGHIPQPAKKCGEQKTWVREGEWAT
jgi:hypothetical protein